MLTVEAGLLELPDLDVSGAKRLTLVAHMEQDWNTGDYANWLDVRLVRQDAE